MTFLYLPVEQTLFTEELGAYRSFGLHVLRDFDGSNQEITFFQDVSTDRALIEQLSVLLNKLQLDPIHIRDIIEDFG